MHKILFLLLVSMITIWGQEVSVKNVEALSDIGDSGFFYPKFGPNDSKLFVTSENYDGIWLYNFSNKKLTQLNSLPGAGYEPVVNFADNKIIFRANKIERGRRYFSLYEQELSSKNLTEIISEQRNLSAPGFSNRNKVSMILNDKPVGYESGQLKKNDTLNEFEVGIDKSNLVLYKNDEKKILNPLGNLNYVWSSLSPDGSKILFTAAGKGSFVCDLNGKIIAELGRANYPTWSPDGKWVLCMRDYDDGYVVTSSDLFLISSDGKQTIRLTETPDAHEMYPTWNKDGKKIACSTPDGQIYILELSFN